MIYKKKELCPPNDEFLTKFFLQGLNPMFRRNRMQKNKQKNDKGCEILQDHKKCIEYIKEVNGLVGAVNCNTPSKIRKLIKLLYDYQWKACNLEEKLKSIEGDKI